MAATTALASVSAFSGASVLGLPTLSTTTPRTARPLTVTANVKKIKVKEPLGPSGDFKNKKGVDAGGRVLKGKGVYQFVDKYGANVDGYSPIYAKDEWSKGGDSYAGGEQLID
uniref:Photosystem II 10 kDa polypeptide, chloroplastic n=1 Tax=Physcomitrium patens TaxID=3218 RepID=A0A7I4DUI3_PHYPA